LASAREITVLAPAAMMASASRLFMVASCER
jgi:hypothetical protein